MFSDSSFDPTSNDCSFCCATQALVNYARSSKEAEEEVSKEVRRWLHLIGTLYCTIDFTGDCLFGYLQIKAIGGQA